MSLIADRNIL